MNEYALDAELPRDLEHIRANIEKVARSYGLDPFPTVFQMLSHYQMNEIASYGGFPIRYPHWRFGMEYEQLSKSTEYGLSKIYEMVINCTPAYAYLLRGNSETDQKLVMAHVYAHVDFFKHNFCFRSTDLDAPGALINPLRLPNPYQPNRRWIDKMANHGARVRRHAERHGTTVVEEFIDTCLSLDNLVDPWLRFKGEKHVVAGENDVPKAIEVPRLRAKDYMESFINPEEYIEKQRKAIELQRAEKRRFPESPERDVLRFLLDHAPLESWEHDVLEVIREEALYFVPQMQTKIMNEGWATYWHSRLMTEKLLTDKEIIDYADNAAGVLATSGGQLNPYKLGVELYRNIEDRWNRGQFGRDWDECNDAEVKRHWDMHLGIGRKRIFEVRSIYNDVTFIDEFLTPEFCIEHKLFTYAWVEKNGRFEIESRAFAAIKDKLLFQLANFGNPYIYVFDANYGNRGELLLKHDHQGIDLREDWAKETLRSLSRLWRRPVRIDTIIEERNAQLSYDGSEHEGSDGGEQK